MAGVYSVRFFVAAGSGIVTSYTVPAGRVAVVRSVVATSTVGAAAFAWLYIGPTPIYYLSFPEPGSARAVEMRQVVNAGEAVRVYTSAPELFVAVSGYLFSNAMSGQVQGEVTREALAEGAPLPA